MPKRRITFRAKGKRVSFFAKAGREIGQRILARRIAGRKAREFGLKKAPRAAVKLELRRLKAERP